MSVKAKLLTILCLACFFGTLSGQNVVEVSEPVLTLKNGKVHIEYKLLNTSKSEKFSIRVDITDQRGYSIDARSLSGDLGKGISGEGNKKIIWDIEADSIFLDEDIFIEVFALPESPPVPAGPLQEQFTEDNGLLENPGEEKHREEPGIEESAIEETSLDKSTKEEPTLEGSSPGIEFNRMSLIAQSIALPGLGLSRLNPGTPHWLKGVASYGCLAGSIYFNRKAWSSYQGYLGAENPAEVDDLFDTAYNEKMTSGILGYAALGIWVVDLAWTVIGTAGMNRDQLSVKQKGLSIGSTMEPVSNFPLIALRYTF